MTGTTRVIGRLRSTAPGKGAVRVEDVYDTDPHDLWSALTEPDRLARWLAVVDGDLRPGGAVTASFVSGWEGPGRIDVCDPPRHLELTMDPGTEDETVIEAVLSAEGERTRLVVEERGIPLAGVAAYGAGWQAHVEDLAAYLSGGGSDWAARWAALTPAYEKLATDLA
jgi:uncharacterized protein YndB with AHSA1/START domain